MAYTIFYSWQSDSPNSTNRGLIRNALDAAAKELASNDAVQDAPRVDSDTAGISGTPEIAAEIFRKIDRASVFVADVSLVGTVGASSPGAKRAPNPNVLVELGYAAARLGWARIVCVMNTAIGKPDEQIFDLLHRRWPVKYDATPEAIDKASIRVALGKELVGALRAVLECELMSARDAACRLDVECLKIMKQHGKQSGFSVRPPSAANMGSILTMLPLNSTINRLIDLGVLECLVDPDAERYSYNWTHLGTSVLRLVGVR